MKLARSILTLSLLLLSNFGVRLNAQGILGNSTIHDIILSAHTNEINFISTISVQCASDREKIGRGMLNVLTNSGSLTINRCTAAYYLGELRFTNSVGVLADHIGLEIDMSEIWMRALVDIRFLMHPAFDALVKIGVPSIPKLLHNLQESDDVKVRDLSLKALYQIEGDKNIAQLRLQKALEMQKVSQRKARLQSALSALAVMQKGE